MIRLIIENFDKIAIGIVLPVLTLYVKYKLEKYNFSKGCKKYDLREHKIFYEFNFWINNRIPRMNDGTLKCKLLTKLLVLKFTFWRDNLCKVAENIMNKQIKRSGDLDFFVNSFYDYVAQYRILAEKAEISSKVLDKFAEWHDSRCEVTYKAICNIHSSKFYDDIKEEYNAILDIFLFALHMTVIDIEASFESFNGNLEAELKAEFEVKKNE